MVAAVNHKTGQGAPPELRMCQKERGRYRAGAVARWSAGGVVAGATESRSVKSRMHWSRITSATMRATLPDDMVTTMASPAGGPVTLQDPRAGITARSFRPGSS